MKKHIAYMTCLLLALLLLLNGCGLGNTRFGTLEQQLRSNPSVLEPIRYTENKRIAFSDYVVYSIDGMSDDINATRYASGLVEVYEQFVEYKYIVERKDGSWKYIFEDFDDIATWALND